jgi:hypothetical protein
MNHLLFLDRWAGAPHAAGAGVVTANRVLSHRRLNGAETSKPFYHKHFLYLSQRLSKICIISEDTYAKGMG